MAEVQLPQLGESVTEGVITSWLVEVGDTVDVDQPIVEISTDKVDTEIPSPVAGTVQELRADVDDTVEVGATIAVIGEDGAETAETAETEETEETEEAAETEGAAEAEPTEEAEPAEETEAETAEPAAEEEEEEEEEPAEPAQRPAARDDGGPAAGTKALASPLVRRMLREAGVKAGDIQGSGPGGRITREDAERAIAEGPKEAPAAEAAPAPAEGARVAPPPAVPAAAATRERPPASPTQVDFGGEPDATQELTRVRKAIAKSMMDSLHNTAQLTAAVEVDLTAIMNLRAAVKDQFKAREGASLSPLPLISRAVCMTLPRHPALNASIDQEAGTATFHNYINLGMAVDTERGLLVPNIKEAQDLTVAGLARAIADVAARTRDKKLSPDEISGGTFTITNTGSRGTLFDTPILHPPQVAIIATCAIEKRPVVVSDAYGDSIAIRWMSYLCLTYDHRMVDGADAARFLQDLTYVLETHDFSAELGL